MPKLEEVFKISGVPTHTFVQPSEYDRLVVALRTPGRGVIVEGPSGIGKTSAIETALRESDSPTATKLSARKKEDVEYIEDLPNNRGAGLVIVDDFHKLKDSTKQGLADYLKSLADEERQDSKIIIIGINRAGEQLVTFASDLVNRIDVIRLEDNPEHKVRELLTKGALALNIKLNIIDDIVAHSQGSFYIAQLLAHECCVRSHVLASTDAVQETQQSFEAVRTAVYDRLSVTYMEVCKKFCQGSRMKAAGRAPYLHIMHELSLSRDWSLSLQDLRPFGNLRASIGQVVEKGFLAELIRGNSSLQDVLHYEETGKILTIDNPQFVFFLRQIAWDTFAKHIGFTSAGFKPSHDFALSFAGSDRSLAEAIFEKLEGEDLTVFYDKNEQYRIVGADLEEYLRPIYSSEAALVVCILGPDYPNRIWTKFESDAFRQRFAAGTVVPIRYTTIPAGIFDETRKIGGLDFDPSKPPGPQVDSICETLIRKLSKIREDSAPS